MAFPCVCYKCARCMTLDTLKDADCLTVEEKNCKERYCHNCDFSCERFIDRMDGRRNNRNLYFVEA